jgi:hypothetical protein
MRIKFNITNNHRNANLNHNEISQYMLEWILSKRQKRTVIVSIKKKCKTFILLMIMNGKQYWGSSKNINGTTMWVSNPTTDNVQRKWNKFVRQFLHFHIHVAFFIVAKIQRQLVSIIIWVNKESTHTNMIIYYMHI